jgi:hypothetical protein
VSKSSAPSGARPSYALGLALVVVVAVAVFFLRPGGDSSDPAPSGGDSASAAPSASGPPPVATDEEFCSEFRLLAESQGTFVSSGETDPGPLRDAADALVAVGVPESMSLPARAGYYTLIDGVYDSIGDSLDPAAVGAPGKAVNGGDAAFSAYLTEFCPA